MPRHFWLLYALELGEKGADNQRQGNQRAAMKKMYLWIDAYQNSISKYK
jgi:hypothetical protein